MYVTQVFLLAILVRFLMAGPPRPFRPGLPRTCQAGPPRPNQPLINEVTILGPSEGLPNLNYGIDLEVAARAGGNSLAGCTISCYYGNGSLLFTSSADVKIPAQQNGYGTEILVKERNSDSILLPLEEIYQVTGLALVCGEVVVDFVSFDGSGATVTALDGPARGCTSTDSGTTIPLFSSGTTTQRYGEGNDKSNFPWRIHAPPSPHEVNDGQFFRSCLPRFPFINEVTILGPSEGLQNYGIDLEVAGRAGNSLARCTISCYYMNGSLLFTTSADVKIPPQQNGYGTEILIKERNSDSILLPLEEIYQVTGLALVCDEVVVDFLSFNGSGATIKARDGPAEGCTSSDSGLRGGPFPPLFSSGTTMQRYGKGNDKSDFPWRIHGPHSAHEVNDGQFFLPHLGGTAKRWWYGGGC